MAPGEGDARIREMLHMAAWIREDAICTVPFAGK